MEIQLSSSVRARLARPVRGRGGFQHLLRKLQAAMNASNVSIELQDCERLARYSHAYGDGGFQRRTLPTASEVQLQLELGAAEHVAES